MDIPAVSMVGGNHGKAMCRVLNLILRNTFIRFYIMAGGGYYRINHFDSMYKGVLRITLEGTYSMIIRWDSQFLVKLGRDYNEYCSGTRPDGILPANWID